MTSGIAHREAHTTDSQQKRCRGSRGANEEFQQHRQGAVRGVRGAETAETPPPVLICRYVTSLWTNHVNLLRFSLFPLSLRPSRPDQSAAQGAQNMEKNRQNSGRNLRATLRGFREIPGRPAQPADGRPTEYARLPAWRLMRFARKLSLEPLNKRFDFVFRRTDRSTL